MRTLFCFCLLPLPLLAGEAVLNVEKRGSDVILYVTGGTTNVQYEIWTAPNPDHNVASTNWYYWRRAYSRDFVANPGHAEILIYGENTSKQPQRFFQIRGVLPDAGQVLFLGPGGLSGDSSLSYLR